MLKKHFQKFTVINGDITQYETTKHLSLKALGLYLYMASKPDGWNFTLRGIATQVKDSIGSITTARDELINFGLLVLTSKKGGQFRDVDWHLFENQINSKEFITQIENDLSDFQYTKNKYIEIPLQDNTNRVNTNKDNISVSENQNKNSNHKPNPLQEEYQVFIDRFNELFNRKHRVTPEVKKHLKARLESFSLDEILKATLNLSRSAYHTGVNDRNWKASPEFLIRNDSQVDRFLNINPMYSPE